jgi:antitoxin VapB
VRAALSRAGDELPWRSQTRPRPPVETKEQLFAAMEEIAVRSAARPLVDSRSRDEIIGYDDFGLPR